MNKVNLLLGRATPRGYIEQVEQNLPRLPCDKIIPMYVAEWHAYQNMRREFLERKQYTHLVLATDDIVVKPKHIRQLQKDLERHDFPVLSGMMNVDLDDKVYLNICMNLPMKDRRLRKYQWMTREELPKQSIFPVKFSGFPLMAIRRDVIEQTNFDADKVFKGLPPYRGASLDFVFCWYCQDIGVPIMVDKRIELLHLRTAGGLKVGQKAKKLIYWPFGKEKIDVTPDEFR